MPINLTASKTKAAATAQLLKGKQKTKASVSELGVKVDRIGQLDAQMTGIMADANEKVAPLATERATLANDVMGSERVLGLGKLDKDTIIGEKFVGQVSAKRKERTIVSTEAVYKHFLKDKNLGLDRFLAICDLRLGDLDKCLTEAEQEKLIASDNTGKRGLKIEPKA